jgi:hypothetical protein
MCNIIFCISISRATSSNFAMYFCDIYFDYITPCTVMIHATSDAIRVTPPRLRTLSLRATVLSSWVDNTMNGSQEKISYMFILFRILDKFSYHILPIIHACNAGISQLQLYVRLLSHARLQSYIPTPVALPDSGRRHNFGCLSWLWLRIMTSVNEHAAYLTTSDVKDFAWTG